MCPPLCYLSNRVCRLCITFAMNDSFIFMSVQFFNRSISRSAFTLRVFYRFTSRFFGRIDFPMQKYLEIPNIIQMQGLQFGNVWGVVYVCIKL